MKRIVFCRTYPGFAGLLLQLLPYLFACYSGVDLGEFCTGSVGDYFCQGGLAGSGRTVEDDGGQLVSFDSPV